MAKKRKTRPSTESANEDTLAVEVGRIAKLLSLFLLKDIGDESDKIARLNGVGFSAQEIAKLLGKTENNVRAQISQAKAKLGK
ncbi:MAG: sigma-70 region 4 domain-containing protein [Candidatus Acidiferrales bacterium]